MIRGGCMPHMSDGPLIISAFREMVIGRVIAVFHPKPRV